MRAACLSFALLFLLACSGSAAKTLVLSRGAYALRISADARTITLERRGAALLALAADGFEIGVVRTLDDEASYDPYWLEEKDGPLAVAPPLDLVFVRVESASARQLDPSTLAIDQVYGGGLTARLELGLQGDPQVASAVRFSARLVPAGSAAIAYLRLRPRASATEAFYGLGEWPDDVNHRGKLRPMQIEAELDSESADNEAHVPVPFLIGSRGWGLFVESRRFGLFDVARKAPDLVEVTFGTGSESKAGLSFHLFAADHPLDITKLYYDVTGYPLLPATWAYGPIIWRNHYVNQAQVEDDIRKIRELDLPTSAIWIDDPHATAINTFDFDPRRYSDPKAMIDQARRAGLRMSLWSVPYLSREAEPYLSQAMGAGYFPKKSGILLNKWGPPIDFTNPDAFGFWQSMLRRYVDLGIEGFKLDYGEDVVAGIAGGRAPWSFADGSDERTMHYGYTLLYHRAYAELLPPSGGFLLCRAGRWGDQRNVSVIWPGDLDATLTRHREPLTAGGRTVLGVGGLATSLVMGLSLGPSGFPFYASDTGGYRHSPADKETFIRWFEQTSVWSAMQIGDSASEPAWVFTPENGRDQSTLDLYRRYTRLHMRLFPYVWTYAKRLAVDGRAITRPLGLAYPELGFHPSDTYLLGDHLLAAPVLDRGARTREVMLPPGEWIDWWDGVRFPSPAGGTKVTIQAPLEKLPLLLARGGIVPLLRPTIATLSPVEDPGIESYANHPGVLYVRIAAGPNSALPLFDHALIEQADQNGELAIHFASGETFREGALLEVIATGLPRDVLLDGIGVLRAHDSAGLEAASSGWAWSADVGGTLWIRVPDGDRRIRVLR